MGGAPATLILDLLEWVALEPRLYAEANRAWRTSCPRLPVWEDAFELGFVRRGSADDAAPTIELTEAGRRALCAARPAARGA